MILVRHSRLPGPQDQHHLDSPTSSQPLAEHPSTQWPTHHVFWHWWYIHRFHCMYNCRSDVWRQSHRSGPATTFKPQQIYIYIYIRKVKSWSWRSFQFQEQQFHTWSVLNTICVIKESTGSEYSTPNHWDHELYSSSCSHQSPME